jgi:hypothetical protein
MSLSGRCRGRVVRREKSSLKTPKNLIFSRFSRMTLSLTSGGCIGYTTQAKAVLIWGYPILWLSHFEVLAFAVLAFVVLAFVVLAVVVVELV